MSSEAVHQYHCADTLIKPVKKLNNKQEKRHQ